MKGANSLQLRGLFALRMQLSTYLGIIIIKFDFTVGKLRFYQNLTP